MALSWLRSAYRAAYLLGRLQAALVRPRTQGAYAAVWWQGRLLCIRNTYRDEITLPSGGIRRGESPRGAAARELLEETGIPAAPDRLDYAGAFTRPHDGRTDTGHFFELPLPVRPRLRIDPLEVAWADFLSPEAVRSPRLSPLVEAYLDHRAR